MQAELDRRIKEAGAENAYFPLFIPESFLKLEAEHVEGFAPELAVVTHGGGKELEEPLVVRPTSETVINSFFAKWVQSHRDLPLLINQWANVVRWELRPRLFLRTTEFLWQEGHTAHATEEDARAYALRILRRRLPRHHGRRAAASPCSPGHKTARERFAGATRTLDVRGDDGRRQGAADGHEPRAGPELRHAPSTSPTPTPTGVLEYVWQTSWGVSTRLVGALVMGHGDDFGLRLPPALAPAQVVVLVVKDDAEVRAAAEALVAELRGGRATGSASTTAPTPASAAAAWTGSSRVSRCGWRSGPATWPRATSPWSPATAGRRRPSPLAGRRRRRSAAVLAAAGRRAPGRGHGGPRRPHGGRRLARGGGRGGSRRASPGSAWGRSGPTARTAWPSTPSRCAACSGPTARWPSRATPRTTSWPWSAGRTRPPGLL